MSFILLKIFLKSTLWAFCVCGIITVSLKKDQNHLVYLNVSTLYSMRIKKKKSHPYFSHEMMRDKVKSELPVLIQPEPASRSCRLCSHTGYHTYKGFALGLMLCATTLKFITFFEQGCPAISFCTGTHKLCSQLCRQRGLLQIKEYYPNCHRILHVFGT